MARVELTAAEKLDQGGALNFEDLKNPEFQEKLKSAKNINELVALAKEEGVDLSDKQLEALSGGNGWV